MSLEDDGEFARAEEFFLKSGKPREAIEMHLHQRDWAAALRICASHDESAVTEVRAAQARDAAEKGDIEAAERLFLDARQAQQAVNLHREAGRWDDAVRVAAAHLPRELAALERERFRATGSSGAAAAPSSGAGAGYGASMDADDAESLLALAARKEAQGDVRGAVATLLRLGADHVSASASASAIAQQLQHAAQLAVSVQGAGAKDSCRQLSGTLVELGEQEAAAEVLAGVGLVEEAVQLLRSHKRFAAAEQLALKHGASALASAARREHEAHLASAGDVDALAEQNQAVAAEVYAKAGQWGKVRALAEKQGGDSVPRYAVSHATALVQQEQHRRALAVWAEHGLALAPRTLLLAKRIAQEVTRLSEPEGSAPAGGPDGVAQPSRERAWQLLRSALGSLLEQVAADEGLQAQLQQPHADALAQLQKLHWAATMQARVLAAAAAGLSSVAAKTATALLREVSSLHSEHAFYQAGLHSKAAATERNSFGSHAYVLLNRFADIYHLIDDASSFAVGNADFRDTELPPPEQTPLPAAHAVSQTDFDEVDMWLLDAVPSNPSLLTAACAKCRKNTFVGNLNCHVCRFRGEACAMTGLRLSAQAQFVATCTNCNSKCNKADFNAWVEHFGKCPCCDVKQQTQY
jgi:intraflagellar transport protein 172